MVRPDGITAEPATEPQALHGRHAVVTGGGRGIGAAIATRLAQCGAAVTLMGRDLAALDAARAAIASTATATIAAEPCDVGDHASVEAAFTAAATRLGPVSVLINNAGAVRPAPFDKLDLGTWNTSLAVNLTGAYLCARAVLPGMKSARWGRIVTVASTAGLVGYRYVTAYCAAKHGVIGLTRALALELAKTGITVNAVCPGYTDTDMVRNAVDNIATKTGRSREAALGELIGANPLGRLIAPAEVADMVSWLCLPASAAITGQAIAIDGGETAS